MARVSRQAFLLTTPEMHKLLHPTGMSASILTLGQNALETLLGSIVKEKWEGGREY